MQRKHPGISKIPFQTPRDTSRRIYIYFKWLTVGLHNRLALQNLPLPEFTFEAEHTNKLAGFFSATFKARLSGHASMEFERGIEKWQSRSLFGRWSYYNREANMV